MSMEKKMSCLPHEKFQSEVNLESKCHLKDSAYLFSTFKFVDQNQDCSMDFASDEIDVCFKEYAPFKGWQEEYFLTRTGQSLSDKLYKVKIQTKKEKQSNYDDFEWVFSLRLPGDLTQDQLKCKISQEVNHAKCKLSRFAKSMKQRTGLKRGVCASAM